MRKGFDGLALLVRAQARSTQRKALIGGCRNTPRNRWLQADRDILNRRVVAGTHEHYVLSFCIGDEHRCFSTGRCRDVEVDARCRARGEHGGGERGPVPRKPRRQRGWRRHAANETITVQSFERRKPARRPLPAHLPRERIV
jgi:hypothetical protein